LFIDRQPVWEILYVFRMDVLCLLPIVICGLAWMIRRFVPGRPVAAVRLPYRCLLYLACWLFVVLASAWALTWFDIARVFLLRYVIVAAAAPILFAALCIEACPGRWGKIACAALLIVAVVHEGRMLDQWQRDGRVIGDRQQDWRAAVDFINNAEVPDSVPVFVRSGLIEADQLGRSTDSRLRAFCLLPVTALYRLTGSPERLIPLPTSDSGNLSQPHRRRIGSSSRVWFLLAASDDYAPHLEREILSACWEEGPDVNVQHRKRFAGITVLLINTGASPRSRVDVDESQVL
jgi:hypothetical protein